MIKSPIAIAREKVIVKLFAEFLKPIGRKGAV
jgi:hypothetical protein